jgi:phosphoglycolate phosphatase
MPFPAVLFDLDGTLLDTLEDIADSANEVLLSLKLPPHEVAAYKQFVGEGVQRLFEKALPAQRRNASLIAQCAAQFNEEYARCWDLKTHPYDGVLSLLEGLRDQGLPLAVLSNKPQAFTVQCVDRYFPAGTFRCVLGQREGVPRKPDPAGALEIAAALGVLPDRMAYLGDSSIDMQTAVRAGMYAIGAQWGFRSREELLAHGAAAVIERPEQLLPLVLATD